MDTKNAPLDAFTTQITILIRNEVRMLGTFCQSDAPHSGTAERANVRMRTLLTKEIPSEIERLRRQIRSISEETEAI